MPHSMLLWFDVEQRYKTISLSSSHEDMQLWFDVEQRYKTILENNNITKQLLWFDVEQRYKTIIIVEREESFSCGLM